MSWEKLAENRIQEAIERGELRPPPAGTPLDLAEYFALPAAERMGWSLLKSADVVPPEIEMLKRIAQLERALSDTADPGAAAQLRDELQMRRVNLALMIERRKAREVLP